MVRRWEAIVEVQREDKLIWIVDGEEVGRGPDIWIVAPQPGQHFIELQREGSEPRRIKIEVINEKW